VLITANKPYGVRSWMMGFGRCVKIKRDKPGKAGTNRDRAKAVKKRVPEDRRGVPPLFFGWIRLDSV